MEEQNPTALADLTIEYTNDDDGIWLLCAKHGKVENLDFFPTIPEIMKAVEVHIETRHQTS
jgi:hypothetical protein